MMQKVILNILSINLLVLVTLSGCKEKESAAQESMETATTNGREVFISTAQFEANAMKIEKVMSQAVKETIHVSGIIDVPPQSVAVLTAIRGGYIRDIPYLVGDPVRKGQALVTLENPEYLSLQQQYLETKEQLSYLGAEYERQKTLIEENITSQKNFLKAESEFKSARARNTGLREQLLMLNIDPARVEAGNLSPAIRLYAPIKGGISKVHATKGMFVSPSMEILEIVDLSHIHLELNVFEKDISKLEIDQSISFTIPEVSEAIHEAEIYLIGNALEDNRTIKVHAHLKEDPDVNFIRGMFVDATIHIKDGISEDTKALTLPESSVVERDGTYFVLRLVKQDDAGYTFSKEEIIPGRTQNNRTEIRSGSIKSEDKILTLGAFDVMPL